MFQITRCLRFALLLSKLQTRACDHEAVAIETAENHNVDRGYIAAWSDSTVPRECNCSCRGISYRTASFGPAAVDGKLCRVAVYIVRARCGTSCGNG
ncbi:hypothetical protein BU25DRAFT_185319 [Macroventuria anomochaeta]|uniref:Uncharacterized protein n=1 Tax=Macroventuria anomochaeta TaxID=301207 RepID=A0ACB6SB16_9PLEO|nr:uncharacterized protein BU25DRAFT_185319 [Macroventuria anomochaeta]KAF2631396.1 hypothetical protein BU25DRAFT_185319 [Macroventuria anomochaeta]